MLLDLRDGKARNRPECAQPGHTELSSAIPCPSRREKPWAYVSFPDTSNGIGVTYAVQYPAASALLALLPGAHAIADSRPWG